MLSDLRRWTRCHLAQLFFLPIKSKLSESTRGHTREDMDKAIDLLKIYGEAFFVLSGEEIGPMEA